PPSYSFKQFEENIIYFLEALKMADTENKIYPCQLLNAKTFGQRLSLSKRQIFRLNSSGKIPAPIRIGGSVRWSEQEISDWLAAGAVDRRTWEQMKQVRE
ncbi:helix-turn-helix transcriptional regulator, partial [Planctomycetota bacterium]